MRKKEFECALMCKMCVCVGGCGWVCVGVRVCVHGYKDEGEDMGRKEQRDGAVKIQSILFIFL